jgi:putative ABC transport system substrate-binding protein
MRRREFVTLIGGMAAAWPLATRGQQPAPPVVGVLRGGGQPNASYFGAFLDGLSALGYVEGRDMTIALRVAEQYDGLPALATELARRNVTVIFADALPAALAARSATTTIPIVFQTGSDPIQAGLVTNLARPTGNLTGIYNFAGGVVPKRLQLLHELVPTASLIAVLINSANPNAQMRSKDLQEAARAIGQQIIVVGAGSERDFAAAFATIVQERAGAVVVTDDPLFGSHSEELVMLATHHTVPAIHSFRRYTVNGGLMSYGTIDTWQFREAGRYVGRILKGEKTVDLPVLQPTKFEFVINLKTAKALGLAVPPALLALADEVIE